jgi:hypothetical protein
MTRISIITFLILTFFLILVSCSTHQKVLFKGRDGLTSPLSYLDDCDDYEQQLVQLDPNREVILLVHGCKASSRRFLTLKKVVESRGQQAICFNYDYRARLEESAGKLLKAINQLNILIGPPQLTIIGHSQGGFVARRALIVERNDSNLLDDIKSIRLVSISTPFNGITASAHCGLKTLHILSGGMTLLICQGIAGAIWSEVHPRASFINQPGKLVDAVYDHIKIVTDERDTCRNRDPSGTCVESDFVFTLEEQYHPLVDNDHRVTNVVLRAGHALAVGSEGHPPHQLIEVLEKHNLIRQDFAVSESEKRALLVKLYQ